MDGHKDSANELPQQIYQRVVSLTAEGDALGRGKEYDEAINKYEGAWNLLPEPKTQWKAATWILAAIGDANFFSERFDAALAAFTSAIVECPGGLENPFLHLRRGEALFELGRLDEAADELIRSYMGAGPDIFKTEDAKYLRYLKSVAQL